MNIATLLEKLINKKFYESKEVIQNKLNVFYAMSKINDEEFSNLTLKIEEIYVEVTETSTEEPVESVVE